MGLRGLQSRAEDIRILQQRQELEKLQKFGVPNLLCAPLIVQLGGSHANVPPVMRQQLPSCPAVNVGRIF